MLALHPQHPRTDGPRDGALSGSLWAKVEPALAQVLEISTAGFRTRYGRQHPGPVRRVAPAELEGGSVKPEQPAAAVGVWGIAEAAPMRSRGKPNRGEPREGEESHRAGTIPQAHPPGVDSSGVARAIEIYRNYDFTTQVLVASVRNPIHVLEVARLGADVATLPFSVINQLAQHPLTDIGIKKFLADWEKVPKK